MKATKIFTSLLLTSLCASVFTSCDTKENIVENPVISTGVYVLNEGEYASNNASLTYYDFATQFASADLFLDKNNRGLGDTGQDMVKYGSKIYIAVYKSSIIEVIDAKSGISTKSIPMKNASGASSSPRSLTTANGQVYIVLYDGHVAQLDTVTLTIGRTIPVGSNPDASVIANNKLYVANTGGMAAVMDSTVSVINLSTFTEEKKITVNMNPAGIKADSYGDVYVASNGNYGSIPGKFQRIEAGTNKVTDINVPVRNFDIEGDNAYIYNFTYDANWQATNKTIAVYDVKSEKLISENLVTTDIQKTPYCIDVDPVSKDIYLGVTDYINNGKMYCFSQEGKLKFTFTTGINPSKLIFISK
ncbi:MAG: hypothetical protein PHT07_20030 [Paludibacter sp.]|nr:hypothetical protein [Paludibacter sp.]